VNATDEVVSSAVVAVPGSRLEVRDLAAGGTHTWRYRSERDACFEVSARLASGSTIEARCVGYTTPNEGISHRLTLNRDRTVEYQVLR
jgi:hypothetical protein